MFGSSTPFYNSVALLILGTAVGMLVTWFWRTRSAVTQRVEDERKARVDEAKRLADENRALMARVGEMEHKLGLLNQVVQPISTAFQAILIKELTHFHTPEMDELMEKVGPPSMLTAIEEKRLFELLEQRRVELDERIPESEREAALMLPFVMKRAKAEQAHIDSGASEMKIVAVPIEPIVAE